MNFDVPKEWLNLANRAKISEVEPIIDKLIDIGSGVDVLNKVARLFKVKKNELVESIDVGTVKETAIYFNNEILVETNTLNKSTIKKLIIGAIIVLSVYVVYHYKQRKKQLGKLYSVKDLLKEVVSILKNVTTSTISDLAKKVYGVILTVFAILIVIFVACKVGILEFDDKDHPVLSLIATLLKGVLKVSKIDDICKTFEKPIPKPYSPYI